MYPIKFKNIYYPKIWGGRGFEAFRDNMPAGGIGESWDVACHKNGMSIVENGTLKGKKLQEIISEYGEDLLGSKVSTERFPLLVKLINSKEDLSVQVHPNDEYALKNENDYGKTEAWYVIDAEPSSKLVIGTKNCSKETFIKAINENRCQELLNYIEVKKGDAFLIKSGMVHAIGSGITIAEIQQNSDLTYRIYDYGRPRELHIEKSLQVIDFSLKPKNLKDKEKKVYSEYDICQLFNNEYFGIDKINIKTEYIDHSEIERFHIVTSVEGNGTIIGGGVISEIKCGDSFFIPAKLGEYKLHGKMSALKSYVTI